MIRKMLAKIRRVNRLPAKVEPKALGLCGEDMTEEMQWLLTYAEQDPARAWDLYKYRLHRHTQPINNRIGEPPPVRVETQKPVVTEWAMVVNGRVARLWTTHLSKEEVEKYWPGFDVVATRDLPPDMRYCALEPPMRMLRKI